MLAEVEHGLTHREMTDGRLTPACVCGWWSPRCSHSDFERHIRRLREANEEVRDAGT
jgi:hypothetical protein